MNSLIKSSILFSVTFFVLNGACGQEKAGNIYSIIDGMEKRFSINIIYNKADLKDNEGQPITLDIDDTKYRQEELTVIIEKTARVEFEEMSNGNWIIKRPEILYSDRLDQMQARLVVLDNKINAINTKIDKLEKLIKQNIDILNAE